MSSRGHASTPPPGHDILARYLMAYAHARQMTDLERPWGLGDDGLDGLWMRLMDANQRNPKRLNELIADELTDADRHHIVATLTPLLFALPLRAYPSELRAERNGPRLILTLRHFANSVPSARSDRSPGPGMKLLKPPAGALPPGKAKAASKKHDDEIIGFLPAAITSSMARHLRRVFKFAPDVSRGEVIVSSGGRRRRVRVTILARDRGVLVRFLERMPSPVDERR